MNTNLNNHFQVQLERKCAFTKYLLHETNVIVTTLWTIVGFMETNRRRIIHVIWTVEGKNYEIIFWNGFWN